MNKLTYILLIISTNIFAQKHNLIGKEYNYLDEVQKVYLLLTDCIFDEDYCIELISKDKRNENLNHRLFSVAARINFDNHDMVRAYKYAKRCEESIYFDNYDMNDIFPIYLKLDLNNYIKEKLLPRFVINSENDKMKYASYLFSINLIDEAFSYLEKNYNFKLDNSIIWEGASQYLYQLWYKNPQKAIQLCEELLIQNHHLLSNLPETIIIEGKDFKEDSKWKIHLTYIYKAMAHSKLKEYDESFKCLNLASDFHQFSSIAHNHMICIFIFQEYAKYTGMSQQAINSKLPKSLIPIQNFCSF